jgi:hypothetical protein
VAEALRVRWGRLWAVEMQLFLERAAEMTNLWAMTRESCLGLVGATGDRAVILRRTCALRRRVR